MTDLTRMPNTTGAGFRADIPIPKGQVVPQRKALAMGKGAPQGGVTVSIPGQPTGAKMDVKVPGWNTDRGMGRTTIPGRS